MRFSYGSEFTNLNRYGPKFLRNVKFIGLGTVFRRPNDWLISNSYGPSLLFLDIVIKNVCATETLL